LSDLGQPLEGLLYTTSLLAGEMLGHPFELHHRVHFAREALAAGREPDAAADAAVMRLVHPLTLRFSDAEVNPLTMRFSDGALERAYAARAFSESYPTVVPACLVLAVLFSLLNLAVPAILPISVTLSALLWTLLGMRTWMHRDADQASARIRFAWCWCVAWGLTSMSMAVAQRRFLLVSGLSFREVACLASLYGLGALFQRLVSLLPATQRMLTVCGFVAGIASWSPMSELGQPREALLMVAAVLIGELLAHPFELRRRVAFARERHELLAAETKIRDHCFQASNDLSACTIFEPTPRVARAP
jgi:hypothetical protein